LSSLTHLVSLSRDWNTHGTRKQGADANAQKFIYMRRIFTTTGALAFSSWVLGCGAFVAAGQVYTNFTIELGPATLVPDATPGIPVYSYVPDGHISYLPDAAGSTNYQMYWAGSTSYRSRGLTLLSQAKNPSSGILAAGSSASDFDNGGAWIVSVHRKDAQNLIGFYHAEDQVWPGYSNPTLIAWKSTAYCWSTNNGVTWIKGGQLLTGATPKPSVPTWGGAGDSCVVYDQANARWVAFYAPEEIYTAISTNETPGPGTWLKYSNGSYSTPGLGGAETPVPGLDSVPGGNPSVHFNTCLQRWVMVWHAWDVPAIVLSTSDDLLNWTPPIPIITVATNQLVRYATIIGRTDQLASRDATLSYGYWTNKTAGFRQFLTRTIRFNLMDAETNGLPDAWEQAFFQQTGVDPNGDADGDGSRNLDEYLAGTNPTNAASALTISSMDVTTGGLVSVQWPSVDYKLYTVQTRAGFTGAWQTIATDVPATPPLNTFTNAATQTGAFYRVSVAPY
jgi:hypothetical protein